MKKLLTLFVAILMATVVSSVKADVSFGYDAGAEVVSTYIWRGQYNGALSFQPDLEIGYDGDVTSLRIGAWGSIGSSDWMFKKGETKFMPELDIIGRFSFFGASVGFNHYYYCDGTSFFNWKSVSEIAEEEGSSTTEVWAGYNFSHQFGEKVGLYVNWYTTIAGNDLNYDEETGEYKRAWSSYLEIGYNYTWESIGLTLGAQVGMSPWKSENLYYNEKFAVVNVAVKLNKEWEVGPCTLDLFAQASVNPDGINKDNCFIWKAGDEKLYLQKVNGVIGLGFWF